MEDSVNLILASSLELTLRLINTIVQQGWKIEHGQIIITGALPKAIPGKPGKYVADFEKLGKTSFEIK